MRPLTISGLRPIQRLAGGEQKSSSRGAFTRQSPNGTSIRCAGEPARILDEHWCMSPYYTGRDDYYKRPTYPLKAVNITLKDYTNGPLENWTTGALHFNGLNQYAVLTNEEISRTVTYSVSYTPPQWVTVTRPKAMSPGQRCEVKLMLQGGEGRNEALCRSELEQEGRWLWRG